MALTSIIDSTSSERRWISQISKLFEKEVQIEINVPVSIFRVPATLSAFKPEAYVPQLVALGPYHHFRPELYEMERYKLAAASRLQKQFQSLEFKQLVDQLTYLEHDIRACYHKYLDFDGETLAWIMAIDGLFLLDFLHSYGEWNENSSPSSTTAHLVDSSGRKLASQSILSDVVMLENQIPIFLLTKILAIQCSILDVGTTLLPPMLIRFCKSLSPLKVREDLLSSQVTEHAHILDLLYHLIVPKLEETPQPNTTYGKWDPKSFGVSQRSDSGNSYQVFAKLWQLLSDLNVGVISKITKLVKKMLGVVGQVVDSVRGIPSLASKNKENIKSEDGNSCEEKKIPIVEEILIPSVSVLIGFGVEFSPTSGDITTIRFDEKERKFYLPKISLDVNSEVVMRNLVAYEASVESETLVFARYMELMNGIIDTAEDAKLLRERKIIKNSLKSDGDVAELFNGMSKAIRLTNVSFIDKVIVDVNKYFYSTEKVRMFLKLKMFVNGSWKLLTILAVILLILLMGLQSFCSVYSCPQIFHTDSSSKE